MPEYDKGFSFKIRYSEEGVEVLKDPRPTVSEVALRLSTMEDGADKERVSKAFDKHQNNPKHTRPFIQL